MNQIQLVLDYETVWSWQRAFSRLTLNRYEKAALQGFFEEMHYLLKRRDAMDEFRLSFAYDETSHRQYPDADQQEELYARTKAYFDTYYGALSHLSSVVSRFSKVFSRTAINENKPFLEWLKKFSEKASPIHNLPESGFVQLESARLFRSILNHPQQFPAPGWMTETRPDYPLVHIVLYGPESRDKVIPPGSNRGPLPNELESDWRMDAPDEVSVTNCLSNVSGVVLAEILAIRDPGAAFIGIQERRNRAVSTVLEVNRRVPPGGNVAIPKPKLL